MTKGSGRSACFRGGVTYGYREYLRKDRVRKSCVASSPVKSRLDGLAKGLTCKALNQSDPFVFIPSPR
jgi:hypothetical protein